MVKKMMIIVGEKILMEALKKLHYCVSFLHCSMHVPYLKLKLMNLTGSC